MDELLKQYFEAFNESFPLQEYHGSRAELELVLQQCLESGVPFNPDFIGADELN